jgi:site-specific DNA-cytosine methylase
VTYTYLDCQGFAGGMACGATLAGWTLVGKREQRGGFGAPLMESNRKFLGDQWDSQACDPAEWDVTDADCVVGTPPCSAWSSMSYGTGKHGVDAPINNCMRDLIGFSARVKPQAVVMESVTNAFTQGQEFMSYLSQELQSKTGLHYFTTHVLQNNLSLGGCTSRRRYFLVLSQFPFGVERAQLDRLPTVADALGDLRELSLTWADQPYNQPATWWSEPLRRPDGLVDGHEYKRNAYTRRLDSLVERVPWNEGDKEADVLRRYYYAHGELPETYRYQVTGSYLTRDKQLLNRNLDPGGFAQTKCWQWDKHGFVISGAGCYMVWHPNGRLFTNREVARVLGFPDSWLIEPSHTTREFHSFWGKGTSVAPARWIMNWVRESLNGNPGSLTGEPLEDGSSLVNVMQDWQRVPVEV